MKDHLLTLAIVLAVISLTAITMTTLIILGTAK